MAGYADDTAIDVKMPDEIPKVWLPSSFMERARVSDFTFSKFGYCIAFRRFTAKHVVVDTALDSNGFHTLSWLPDREHGQRQTRLGSC